MIQDTVVGFSACPWFKLLCPCLCVSVALFRVGRIAVVVESNRMKDAICTTCYGSEFSRMLTQLENQLSIHPLTSVHLLRMFCYFQNTDILAFFENCNSNLSTFHPYLQPPCRTAQSVP